MKTALVHLYNAFFGSAVSFRKKILNVLAVTGVLAGLFMGSFNVFNSGGVSVLLGFGVAAFSFGILIFVAVTGFYRAACILTIFVIFLGYFPYLFFSMGGFYGSKAVNFIFAIAFTSYILEGKLGWIMIAVQMLTYAGVCVYAFVNPGSVTPLPAGFNHMLDTVVTVTFVGLAISIVFRLHHRMFNEQNSLLSEVNLSKTQFLADSSHEMRTPLTIISISVQNAIDILNDMDAADSKAVSLLADTQSEVMRLTRMVRGMLTVASASEVIERSRLDISEIFRTLAGILGLYAQERSNTLKIMADEKLMVFGDADLLYQMTLNLIINADKHTENDIILLSAVRKNGQISMTVRDNGEGIPASLLPHVFERGVTDGRGTGYGLYLCRIVVESHGGEIRIESEQGMGTAVHVTLPEYEGG